MEASLLIAVQDLRPDSLFGEDQQKRVTTLVEEWRAMRNQGQELPRAEQEELDTLVKAELAASAFRSAALADERCL